MTSSHRLTTACIICSIKKIVTPDSLILRISRMASSVSAGLRPAIFSSRNSISGFVARALAISRRFWSGVPMSLESTWRFSKRPVNMARSLASLTLLAPA